MIELSKEEYEKFKKLSSKRKTTFWNEETPLMSDRARWVISTPHLAGKLVGEIRKQRKNK